MNVLQLKTSLFSNAGQSSILADEFIARRGAVEAGSRVVVRNLADTPVPHLSAERFQAFLAKPEERTAAQREVAAFSDGETKD